MENYQGNSKKDKEQKQKPEVKKVVTGQVVSKPPSLGSRIKSVFFGGEAREAGGYLLGEVLLPAFRNLVVDAVRIGTERIVYGESLPRRRPSQPMDVRYSPRVSYSTPPRRDREQGYLPDQRGLMPSRKRQTEEISFQRREDAEATLEQLIDVIDQYDVVSLADLYDTVGLPTTPIDNKWGWTFLTNVSISQTRDGFVIDLPNAEPI